MFLLFNYIKNMANDEIKKVREQIRGLKYNLRSVFLYLSYLKLFTNFFFREFTANGGFKIFNFFLLFFDYFQEINRYAVIFY